MFCTKLALLFSALALPFTLHATGDSACVNTSADKAAVVETMRTMYAAGAADDLEKFYTVAAPDFYAFDNGKRFDGDALINMAKTYHDQGYVFVWTVTDPSVEGDCRFAWITYTNRGSIQAKSGVPQPTTWLESAMLEKQNGTWRIRFFHSTRVP